MSNAERFNQALTCERPVACLREVVQQLVSQGETRESIYEDLEDFRALLRAGRREEDEDIVLEVMDFLTGFCAPHMRI